MITVTDVAGGSFPDSRQKLLLNAALGEGEQAVRSWEEWFDGGNLDRMDAASFRLLPLLHHNLTRLGVKDPAMARLKGVRRRAWYQNQMVLREMIPLFRDWMARGIPVTLLKGAALSSLHYKDVSLRAMADVDVLVPPQEVRRLLAELSSFAGWERLTWAPEPLTDAFLDFRHAIGMRAASGSQIDLHWHVLYTCCHTDIDEWLLRNAVEVDLMGTTFRALDPTGQLIHNCVHGMYPDGPVKIHWIADAVTILKTSVVDWDRVLEFASMTNHTVLLKVPLSYLRTEFDVGIPSGVLDRLDDSKVTPAERAEAWRLLHPMQALGVADTVRAQLARFRRSGSNLDWLRHVQYTWRADSAAEVVKSFAKWLRRRQDMRSEEFVRKDQTL